MSFQLFFVCSTIFFIAHRITSFYPSPHLISQHFLIFNTCNTCIHIYHHIRELCSLSILFFVVINSSSCHQFQSYFHQSASGFTLTNLDFAYPKSRQNPFFLSLDFLSVPHFLICCQLSLRSEATRAACRDSKCCPFRSRSD